MITQTFIIKLKEEDKSRLSFDKTLYQLLSTNKVSARCMVRRDTKEKNSWTIISDCLKPK